MMPKIAVAISGGVDSLVAAYRLKKQYHHIIGIHFLTGYEQTHHLHPSHPACPTSINSFKDSCQPVLFDPPPDHPIQRIADQLDLPIQLLDCRRVFQKEIVDYFVHAYQNGQTPNPCMVCNQKIKFGRVLAAARQLGVKAFATGHYARITQENKWARIRRGADTLKDQSYFLAFLKPENLSFIRLPLGDLTKKQVREIAASEKLSPLSVKESQDICFIPNNDYSGFIASQPGFSAQPGRIVDATGKMIGTHDGLHQFTIGQRRGIHCPAAAPYYVTQIDVAGNRLVVGSKEQVFRSNCFIRNINWFITPPADPLEISVQIRYRHHPTPALLVAGNDSDSATLQFNQPQAAVTPGQAAVCYRDDVIVAGGWIHE